MAYFLDSSEYNEMNAIVKNIKMCLHLPTLLLWMYSDLGNGILLLCAIAQ